MTNYFSTQISKLLKKKKMEIVRKMIIVGRGSMQWMYE